MMRSTGKFKTRCAANGWQVICTGHASLGWRWLVRRFLPKRRRGGALVGLRTVSWSGNVKSLTKLSFRLSISIFSARFALGFGEKQRPLRKFYAELATI
jgi:hypothetical protein